MIAVRRGETIEVAAVAKINLFLEICQKRPDGFHEIETLMAAVALADEVQFTPLRDADEAGNADDQDAAAITVACQWAPGLPAAISHSPLPPPEDNLAHRALVALRNLAIQQSKRETGKLGGRLTIFKRVPAAAGMGGASADAAAALVAANIGWRLNYSHQQLAEIAAELGSDVPFFLGQNNQSHPAPAVCTGRGEKIRPLIAFAPLHLVIARPAVGLSTPAVYRVCQPSQQPETCEDLVSALQQGNAIAAGQRLKNQLQPAANLVEPEAMTAMHRVMQACGFRGWQMSGSGTAFFGIARHARHARRTAARLRAAGTGFAQHTQTV